jgi:hypothetical protein
VLVLWCCCCCVCLPVTITHHVPFTILSLGLARCCLLAACCVSPGHPGRYYIRLLSQREGPLSPYPSTCSRSEEGLLLLLDYILFILLVVSTVLYYLQPSFAHIASLSRAVTYLLGSSTYPVTCLLLSSPDAHSTVGSSFLSHLWIVQGPDLNQTGRSPSPSRRAAIVPAGSISSAAALLPPIRVSTPPQGTTCNIHSLVLIAHAPLMLL